MNKENKRYYPCYSNYQKNFLKRKGIDYLIKCRDYNTKNPLWLFMFDNEGLLNKYLKEWSEGSYEK